MTKKFHIESTAGVDMGVYEGETEAEALDAMARDAGYADYADACDVTGGSRDDLIVTEC